MGDRRVQQFVLYLQCESTDQGLIHLGDKPQGFSGLVLDQRLELVLKRLGVLIRLGGEDQMAPNDIAGFVILVFETPEH